jgi:hypothetical protein
LPRLTLTSFRWPLKPSPWSNLQSQPDQRDD